jgi:hypothetical protein
MVAPKPYLSLPGEMSWERIIEGAEFGANHLPTPRESIPG